MIEIDDLIAEYERDPEKRKAIQEGRRWVNEVLLPRLGLEPREGWGD